MKKVIVLLISILALIPNKAVSQSSEMSSRLRFEMGIGLGGVGQGGGATGRLALCFIHRKWGGLARITVQDGAEGKQKNWLGSYPVETFHDNAFLLSRVISKRNNPQFLFSAGIGSIRGEKLDGKKRDLNEINPAIGFAYEVGCASTENTVGISLNHIGNINKETFFYGFVLSFSLATDL